MKKLCFYSSALNRNHVNKKRVNGYMTATEDFNMAYNHGGINPIACSKVLKSFKKLKRKWLYGDKPHFCRPSITEKFTKVSRSH
jgi:hypothetical protein